MFEGFTERPLEDFGGLNSISSNAVDVPAGEATDLLNIDFISGNVYTRDGLTTVATMFTGGNVVSIKEYVLLDPSQRRVLAMNSLGLMAKETGSYAFTTVSSDIAELSVAASLRFKSQTLFGREYIALSTVGTSGILGYGLPNFYDDTDLYRIAPDGPGAAPTAIDSATVGSVDVGVHQARIFARTASGYWTALGPPVSWTAAGLKSVDFANIPTGPNFWLNRVIACSPVGNTTDFYFIEGTSMVIGDNITTTATCNFNDSLLIAGTAVSSTIDPSIDQMRQICLPAQANVMAYNRRLAWIGERNAILLNGDNGFRNLGFNGGTQASAPNVPCGWTERVAGESVAFTNSPQGTILRITGNGVGQRGVLQNVGNALTVIDAGKQVNCRIRAKRSSVGAVSGSFHVWLTPSGTASNTPPAGQNFQVNLTQLDGTEWRVIDGTMMTTVLPDSTWVMRIGTGDGIVGAILPNNDRIDVNYIELYTAAEPTSGSLVRWSKVDDPEAYDGLTGIMNVNENDGQRLNAMFRMRSSAYFVKDRSIYVAQDNGQTEPNEWSIDVVSDTVGTPSANGVAVTDTWALICARAGVHFFSGGDPVNISHKIRTTWQRINWTVGYKIWILLDVEQKRFEIGVPLDGATEVNYIIYCRYNGATPSLAPTYMGADATTNWSIWTSTSSSACFSERSDGTRVWLEGANDGTGNIARRDSTNHTDYYVAAVSPGTAYTSYYQTYFFGDEAQMSGIQLFGYLTANIYGSGSIQIDLYSPDSLTVTQLGTVPITLTSFNSDIEVPAQLAIARVALRFTSIGTGGWFAINQTSVFTRLHPYLVLRGTMAQ